MSEELHHPNYVRIWGILLVLLAISVAGPFLGIGFVTLITAFGIAVVKAYLVIKNFMHLNVQPKYAIYLLSTVLVFMLLFFAGTAPDVTWEGNTFVNWGTPRSTFEPNAVESLSNLNTFDTAAGIGVLAGDLNVDGTWTNALGPYFIDGFLQPIGTDGPDGITTLTLDPGVEMRFTPGDSGILAGFSTVLRDNTVTGNGSHGIATGVGVVIEGCVSAQNGGDGIRVIGYSVIRGNLSRQNTGAGFNNVGPGSPSGIAHNVFSVNTGGDIIGSFNQTGTNQCGENTTCP